LTNIFISDHAETVHSRCACDQDVWSWEHSREWRRTITRWTSDQVEKFVL